MIKQQTRRRHGPGNLGPTRGRTDEPELVGLLDHYGIAFVCAYPQILFESCADLGPDSAQGRLDRMLEGYQILSEIYAPHVSEADRARGDEYSQSARRYL